MASLQSRYLEQLEKNPTGKAVGFIDANCHTEWRTREEFHRNAMAHAARLRQEGIQKGDVVLIVLPSNELSATALTGALHLGVIPLLIAPPILQGAQSSLGEILLKTIERTNARAVICASSLENMRDRLLATGDGTRYLFESEIPGAEPEDIAPVVPDENDIAAYQLTSGTTGFPRVCMWKQGPVLAALDGMVAAMKLEPQDICFNWTPLYHDMGLVNNFLTCITTGVPMVFQSPHDFVKKPALWLKGLQATGANTTWSPNFGFALSAKMVKDEDLEGVRLDHVKAFWNAAERIHYDTMLAFHQRFEKFGVKKSALKTNFGCAENVGGATFSDPDGEYLVERVLLSRLQDDRIAEIAPDSTPDNETMTLVSAGRPHPGMTVKILGDDNEELPEGHVGALALNTPSRMIGYLDDPESTSQALVGDLLKTGDLAYLRGEEVYWAGRIKERITIRGKKVDPSDFEPILFQIDGLRPGCFVAFGVDDSERGTQRIVIVSEVQDGNTKEPKKLQREVRAKVNLGLGIEVSETVLVKKGTLTKTSSGKRRHRHFRDLYLAGKLDEHLATAEPVKE